MTTRASTPVTGRLAVVLLVLFAILAPAGRADEPVAVVGTDWVLEKLGGKPVAAEGRGGIPTLRIDKADDRVTASGHAGVNRFRGTATIGEDGKLRFGPLMTTRMAGPPEAMDLEQRFLEALGKTESHAIADGRLVLSGGGKPLLEFVAQPPVVSGTIAAGEGVDLPEGASVEVVLEDVSLADAPSTVIARRLLEDCSELPAAFSLEYDPVKIEPNRTYNLRVRITDQDGKLLFITDTAHSVLTRGAGRTVEAKLRKIR